MSAEIVPIFSRQRTAMLEWRQDEMEDLARIQRMLIEAGVIGGGLHSSRRMESTLVDATVFYTGQLINGQTVSFVTIRKEEKFYQGTKYYLSLLMPKPYGHDPKMHRIADLRFAYEMTDLWLDGAGRQYRPVGPDVDGGPGFRY